jgi:hypothetical protein
MARIISQSVYKAATPEWPESWLFRMADGTMWLLNPATGVWNQAPPLPGSRVVSNIDYQRGCAFACATDGTIFSGVIQAGFAWQLVAQTP